MVTPLYILGIYSMKEILLTTYVTNILSMSPGLILQIIIKFPYNAHSDWLKQRTSSEYKGQVNDIKLAFKFLLRNFDKFDLN